jgi:spermidine synthase
VARSDARRFDAAQARQRMAHRALPEVSTELGLEDLLAVFGSFVAGPASLARFAGDAPLNTDDHPVVAYRAPRVTYAPESSPRARLSRVLAALSIEPAELFAPDGDPVWSGRLSAYWLARDHFILSGRNVRPANRVADMLRQVRVPLLSVLRISPDFRPAYDPLLSMAAALARSDVAGARELLRELERIQPARTEASQMLALHQGEASRAADRAQ